MKVSVNINSDIITAGEASVVGHLCDGLMKDIESLKCNKCTAESEVVLHVNTSKFSALRTEIKACCPEFHAEIENAMLVEA
ncbi:hypothetical protein [Fulvivirga lutimaris]|uniref:hypothetical protein n=1 Tax=Fulvivirga lutimaris TaxID=1819566 RepID=UPI0012BD706F|nr:hypothetical protein [Fulvivirga lutimaris]MTI41840.1 hypothetical protein [Fulvivirga lutimaris]